MPADFCLADIKTAVVSTAAAGDTTIVTNSSTTQKIIVLSYVLVNTTANGVGWKFGAAAASGVMDMAANGVVSAGNGTGAVLTGSAGANLVINLANATKVAGHVTYINA